jgi:hypothetical protein
MVELGELIINQQSLMRLDLINEEETVIIEEKEMRIVDGNILMVIINEDCIRCWLYLYSAIVCILDYNDVVI